MGDQVTISIWAFDPRAIEAVQDYALTHDRPLEVVQKKAIRCARATAPSFNGYYANAIDLWWHPAISERKESVGGQPS